MKLEVIRTILGKKVNGVCEVLKGGEAKGFGTEAIYFV